MGGYGPLQAKFWRVKTEVPGRFQGLGPLKKILQKKCYRMVPSKRKLGAHIPGLHLLWMESMPQGSARDMVFLHPFFLEPIFNF